MVVNQLDIYIYISEKICIRVIIGTLFGYTALVFHSCTNPLNIRRTIIGYTMSLDVHGKTTFKNKLQSSRHLLGPVGTF